MSYYRMRIEEPEKFKNYYNSWLDQLDDYCRKHNLTRIQATMIMEDTEGLKKLFWNDFEAFTSEVLRK